MTKDNRYRQTIELLFDFLYDDSETDPVKIKEFLAQEGYDYEELANEGMQFVNDLIRRTRSKLAREKKTSILESLANLGKGMAQESRDALFKKLQELTAGEPELQLAFHKLETLSDDDLRAILNDIESLRIRRRNNNRAEMPGDEAQS